MFITISHHSTGATIYETKCPAHLRVATRGAQLGWAVRQAAERGIGLPNADLTGAVLLDARLRGIDLTGADLTGAG